MVLVLHEASDAESLGAAKPREGEDAVWKFHAVIPSPTLMVTL